MTETTIVVDSRDLNELYYAFRNRGPSTIKSKVYEALHVLDPDLAKRLLDDDEED